MGTRLTAPRRFIDVRGLTQTASRISIITSRVIRVLPTDAPAQGVTRNPITPAQKLSLPYSDALCSATSEYVVETGHGDDASSKFACAQ
jgi:hypothetical protein